MMVENNSSSPERAQIERLLADPLFSQSKRYAQFLRYVTERALSNPNAPLNERTIGVEVFGRPHNYETDADPIVRVTASELRKRLAQYYEDPAHANEIRVVIHKGTYQAEFLPPGARPKTKDDEDAAQVPQEPAKPAWRAKLFSWPLLAALAGVCIFGAGWILLAHARFSPIDRLWAPLYDSPNAILLSIPQFSDHVTFDGAESPKLFWRDALTPVPDAMDVDWDRYSRTLVHMWDLSAACRIAEFLGGKGKRTVVRGEHDLTMRELRESPSVIIGGLTNQWTARLAPEARFSFDGEGTLRFIRDRQNPSGREWKFDARVRSSNRDREFMIISRLADSVTGHPVLLVGGFSGWGTEVAIDVLTDPNLMAAVLKDAPVNWDARNVQLVLEGTVINRQAGTPRLVAVHAW